MTTPESTTGMLFVTMQPKESLSLDLFHDWYNNEHGPNRTRLPFIKNGFRYRATDLVDGPGNGSQAKPEYLAIYDIDDMHQLTLEPYQKFRTPPWKTQREVDVMAQIHVDRTLFDFLGEQTNHNTFVPLESPKYFKEAAAGNFLTTSRYRMGNEHLSKVVDSLQQSVYPAMTKIPGWRRTRWYKRSYLEYQLQKQAEVLVIHEYTPLTDVESFYTFSKTPIPDTESVHRTYSLFYTFGSAARNLAITAPWKAYDNVTRTIPAASSSYSASSIESTVTTPDGTVLPFRLEGVTSDPEAPVILLVNSVLVTYGIWDGFVKHFLSSQENRKYRILRFMSRGRFSNTGSTTPVTVDLLASDIIHLLDSLRIPYVACLVGVSLGGATTLATALKYPSRIQAFVSCDTSPKSPAGNRDAWGQRIAVAEKEAKKLPITSIFDNDESVAPANKEVEPEPVVGEELAEMTVRRWFAAKSYEDANLATEIERVKHMIVTNSLPGFSRGVEALFDYDYSQLLPTYKGKGAFLVGAEDGVLPKSMEATAKKLGSDVGSSAEFKLVQGAGHLPMVERPQEVADFVGEFLKRS